MSGFNFVIFTDLDGTFLDRKTFLPGRALKTHQNCLDNGIPVVFVSAKTRAEIEFIREEIHNDSPFVCENGGGLYLPVESFKKPDGFEKSGRYWRMDSAISPEMLIPALADAAGAAGVEIRSFQDMTVAEISSLTGLKPDQAKRARLREYDEPFLILDETPAKIRALKTEILDRGLGYTSGGSFHHITGSFDKGRTLLKLKEIYLGLDPELEFIGVGDAANDLPMLRIVDYPFLVRKTDGSFEKDLNAPGIEVTGGIGPDGFAEAIEAIIKFPRDKQL